MNKHARMTAFVATLDTDPVVALDPCYQGYFRCFNEGRYYEAHDVLEHLWLRGGRGDPNHAFFKGLIQVAGAFVHLRKQHEQPTHAKHGRRLRPAVRLFALAGYGSSHMGLDLHAVRALCVDVAASVIGSNFERNPWSPASLPQIGLEFLP